MKRSLVPSKVAALCAAVWLPFVATATAQEPPKLNKWGTTFCPLVAIAQKQADIGDAESINRMLAEITEEFDFALSKTVSPASPHFKALENVWASLGMFIKEAGNHLTVAGMRGFTRFSGGIIRSNGDEYIEELRSVFLMPDGSFDGVGFDAVMRSLSDPQTGFRLSRVNQGTWRSPEGLVYEAYDATVGQGHRVTHVLTHSVPDYKTGTHSVFGSPSGNILPRGEILPLLDEAWLSQKYHPVLPDGTEDLRVWIAPMQKVVGTTQETSVKLVVKEAGSKIITTAHPWSGG